MKKAILTLGLLSGLTAQNIHEYSITKDEIPSGKIVFNESSAGSLRVDLQIPFPYIGETINEVRDYFGADPIYMYSESARFIKPNDSTYFEYLSDRKIKYKLRDGKWHLSKYLGSDSSLKKLEGKTVQGRPIVDIIEDRFNGKELKNIEAIILGSSYRGEIGQPIKYRNFSKLNILIDEFEIYSNGEWKKVKNDPEVKIGNITTILIGDKVYSALLNIRGSSPTQLKIEKQ